MNLANGPDTALGRVKVLDPVSRVAFVKVKPLVVDSDFPTALLQQTIPDAFFVQCFEGRELGYASVEFVDSFNNW